MSDEAAFLAALEANPADDTARLVYADWLDEHHEPLKAEYLRLTARLPLIGDDVELSSAEAKRVCGLGPSLPAEWKEAAAGRFDLVMLDFNDKVRAVKRVREVFAVGLDSAVGIVECVPNRLFVRVPFDFAASLLERLRDNSGVTLGIRRYECGGEPQPARLQVLATCTPYTGDHDCEAWGLAPKRDENARAALAGLVAAALEIGYDDARARITAAFIPEDRYSTLCFVLAENLSLPEAQRLVARCAPFITVSRSFGVECLITGRVTPSL